MAIIEQLKYRPCDGDDPDDYRPRSSWAAAIDPATSDGTYVRDLSLLVDVVAPGDRVPLHSHPVDELIVLSEGTAELTLGEETKVVNAGAVTFVPAETVHGAVNRGSTPARFLGFFATERVGLRYIERNAAPGTEGRPPGPPVEIDVRSEAAPLAT